MPLAAFPKCFLGSMNSGEMAVETWIDLAAEHLNVDGLECFTGFLPLHDERRLEAIRSYSEARGLPLPMLCHSPDFTQPDSESRNAEVQRQIDAIRAAKTIGAGFCRVLSGQRRPGLSSSEGVRLAAECIQRCLGEADTQGVVLVLENHYKDGLWHYPEFAQKRDDFLALVDAIGDSPWFGINFDPSNAVVAGDDPIELLETVKHKVRTMHASDRWLTPGATLEDLRKFDASGSTGYAAIFKHGVIGEGINDYDGMFSILAGVGFQGWISIEDGQDPDTGMQDLAASAVYLRSKMAEHGLS